MWPRVMECMLGCWLLVSPFVFRYEGSWDGWWISDYVVGLSVIAFGLLSYWRPTRHLHLATLVAATWLVLYGRFGHEYPFPPAAQNSITIGFLLMMVAILPNHVAHPPEAWEQDAEVQEPRVQSES